MSVRNIVRAPTSNPHREPRHIGISLIFGKRRIIWVILSISWYRNLHIYKIDETSDRRFWANNHAVNDTPKGLPGLKCGYLRYSLPTGRDLPYCRITHNMPLKTLVWDYGGLCGWETLGSAVLEVTDFIVTTVGSSNTYPYFKMLDYRKTRWDCHVSL